MNLWPFRQAGGDTRVPAAPTALAVGKSASKQGGNRLRWGEACQAVAPKASRIRQHGELPEFLRLRSTHRI
jgi:hypothetical protein